MKTLFELLALCALHFFVLCVLIDAPKRIKEDYAGYKKINEEYLKGFGLWDKKKEISNTFYQTLLIAVLAVLFEAFLIVVTASILQQFK